DDDWERPNRPSKCTYKLNGDGLAPQASPHIHRDSYYRTGSIKPNILYCMNDSPLIRINRITKNDGVPCEILAKCEFFNPGGSVKDRIAVRMVEDAEERGLIQPGWVLIEPTSGNTGIGIAITCIVKGYRCVIVISEKMSKEKVDIMKALGAEIVQTPTSVSYDAPSSNYRMASKLANTIPKSHILNQFRNASNPIAHYDGTAEEILNACDGKLNMLVCSAGTGGTLSGIARKIKERLPDCLIVGVDPIGSILATPDEVNETSTAFYEIEGIGDDFLPTTLDRKIVDKWYKVGDKESFIMSRRLAREEGFLCGGSSGAAMYCAIKAAKEFNLTANMRVVVLLPDSIRNYMSKFLSDEWMIARAFLDTQTKSHDYTWFIIIS
ncbi:hypothetical protein HELRODRAFT_79716, partial [Helobdella robusta]|uniref:cystathionine beta-synthase n=1 Tax=Helobdella robusta TaxID=6412 RepID=T1G3S7_HELRO